MAIAFVGFFERSRLLLNRTSPLRISPDDVSSSTGNDVIPGLRIADSAVLSILLPAALSCHYRRRLLGARDITTGSRMVLGWLQ